ncbi:MAG: DUF4846 domain-containing protein [Chitinophagaceae bacterium]
MLKKLLPFFIVATTWGLLIWTIVITMNLKLPEDKKPAASFTNKPAWYKTIGDIPPPEDYHRLQYAKGSFPYFLQSLPLKKDKTVYLYNGEKKQDQTAQFAVINMSVGKENLQQCADAVMRLWAEYWWQRGDLTRISFKDNNGRNYKLAPGSSRLQFDNYLARVFGMCGSYSLSKQLHPVDIKAMQCGDVFIRGGFPGHAVLVVDMAENTTTHTRMYMLAQGYMPAQDMHLLNNPLRPGNPWYKLDDTAATIYTPQYWFKKWELKRF